MAAINRNEERVRQYLDFYKARLDSAIISGYMPAREKLQMARYIQRDVRKMHEFDISSDVMSRVTELGNSAMALEATLVEQYASTTRGTGSLHLREKPF